MMIFNWMWCTTDLISCFKKSMDEKSSPSLAQARVLSFISLKLALAAVRG
jgi:hypothetical protein